MWSNAKGNIFLRELYFAPQWNFVRFYFWFRRYAPFCGLWMRASCISHFNFLIEFATKQTEPHDDMSIEEAIDANKNFKEFLATQQFTFPQKVKTEKKLILK